MERRMMLQAMVDRRSAEERAAAPLPLQQPDLEDDEATLIMNWGSEVDDMNMKIYYVNAYSSDSYTMADENNTHPNDPAKLSPRHPARRTPPARTTHDANPKKNTIEKPLKTQN